MLVCPSKKSVRKFILWPNMFRKFSHFSRGVSSTYLNRSSTKSRAMGQKQKFSVTGGGLLYRIFQPRSSYNTIWEMLLYYATDAMLTGGRGDWLMALKRARGKWAEAESQRTWVRKNREWKRRYGLPGKGKGRGPIVTIDVQDWDNTGTACMAMCRWGHLAGSRRYSRRNLAGGKH